MMGEEEQNKEHSLLCAGKQKTKFELIVCLNEVLSLHYAVNHVC